MEINIQGKTQEEIDEIVKKLKEKRVRFYFLGIDYNASPEKIVVDTF